MRRIIVITLLSTCIVGASSINKTIDELLENEVEQELSIPQYDPFKRAKPLIKQKKSGKRVYKPAPKELTAVFNDKAFINGRWYQKGDVLPEGKLIKINATHVYLKKGTTIKVLTLKKRKNLLKISQKVEE